LLVSFAEKVEAMNIIKFEDACTIMMHSGCSAFQDRSFPEGVDNLFFEKFGMSGNDVKNLLFGDFERDV
jgi:hypothetical protein